MKRPMAEAESSIHENVNYFTILCKPLFRERLAEPKSAWPSLNIEMPNLIDIIFLESNGSQKSCAPDFGA